MSYHNRKDPSQPQFLHQPILMRAMRSLDAPFGLGRIGEFPKTGAKEAR